MTRRKLVGRVSSNISNNWQNMTYTQGYLEQPRSRPALSHVAFQELILKISRDYGFKSLLDLGSGSGALFAGRVAGFERQFEKIYCVDANSQMLASIGSLLPKATLIEANLEDITFPFESRIDIAVFSHILEMLESPEQALRQARNLVSGKCLIEFFEPPNDAPDRVEIRYFSKQEGGLPYLRRKIGKADYLGWLERSGFNLENTITLPDSGEIHILV